MLFFECKRCHFFHHLIIGFYIYNIDMKDDYLTKGLSSLDVLERIKKGQVNVMEDETIKTPAMIIFSNVFNLFNALNLFLALLVVLSGHFRNMLFMGVVITNTVIGIFQEIRSYHKLNKLRLLNAPHATIIRDGQEAKITGDKIVLGDLLRLGIGQEVLSDVIVLNGGVLVLEAMLTGESDEIYKQKGDKVYAGSIITKGEALCKVVAVGQDNYIAHIAKKVKRAKRQPSRLRDALDFIVKMVAIIILPLGILLFLKQYLISGLDLDDALLPEGVEVGHDVGMLLACFFVAPTHPFLLRTTFGVLVFNAEALGDLRADPIAAALFPLRFNTLLQSNHEVARACGVTVGGDVVEFLLHHVRQNQVGPASGGGHLVVNDKDELALLFVGQNLGRSVVVGVLVHIDVGALRPQELDADVKLVLAAHTVSCGGHLFAVVDRIRPGEERNKRFHGVLACGQTHIAHADVAFAAAVTGAWQANVAGQNR